MERGQLPLAEWPNHVRLPALYLLHGTMTIRRRITDCATPWRFAVPTELSALRLCTETGLRPEDCSEHDCRTELFYNGQHLRDRTVNVVPTDA